MRGTVGWVWILQRCLGHTSPMPALPGLGVCCSHGCLGEGLPGCWEIIVQWKHLGWLYCFFKRRGELPGACSRSLWGCAVAVVQCEPWGRTWC